MTTKLGLSQKTKLRSLKGLMYVQFGLVAGLTAYAFYDGMAGIISFLLSDILPYYYSLTEVKP
jgi:hypothetical protein